MRRRATKLSRPSPGSVTLTPAGKPSLRPHLTSCGRAISRGASLRTARAASAARRSSGSPRSASFFRLSFLSLVLSPRYSLRSESHFVTVPTETPSRFASRRMSTAPRHEPTKGVEDRTIFARHDFLWDVSNSFRKHTRKHAIQNPCLGAPACAGGPPGRERHPCKSRLHDWPRSPLSERSAPRCSHTPPLPRASSSYRLVPAAPLHAARVSRSAPMSVGRPQSTYICVQRIGRLQHHPASVSRVPIVLCAPCAAMQGLRPVLPDAQRLRRARAAVLLVIAQGPATRPPRVRFGRRGPPRRSWAVLRMSPG